MTASQPTTSTEPLETSTLDAVQVATHLATHPDFFCEHPDLLATLIVPHPQNGQAVSLLERQSQVQRQRIHQLENHVAELRRHGSDNDALVNKLVTWARALLGAADARALPDIAVEQMKKIFNVPYAALRVWDVDAAYQDEPWAEPVNDDIKRLARSMHAPFAGANAGFEAAIWMHPNVATIRSLALMPLRLERRAASDLPELLESERLESLESEPLESEPSQRDAPATLPFGLLVLGSDERDRFQTTMGTEFLTRFADLAAEALGRLRVAPTAATAPELNAVVLDPA